VYSEADETSLHVLLADEAVCIGPPSPKESYLNIPAIISAAEITGAEAIHPGYGFLAENPEFSEICKKCGFKFIGPEGFMIQKWGDKLHTRETVAKFNIPVLKGSKGLDNIQEAQKEAEKIGFPVILKASGGGGGRGMEIVRNQKELESTFEKSISETKAGFKKSEVFLEKYLEPSRHIEFQILADNYGKVVVLGERECSIQRRYQKLIEEAPSFFITQKIRDEITDLITKLIKEVGYQGAGTLEFLFDSERRWYFMEMNTRIQVEHPVTEMITSIDLIKEQIKIAAGEKLSFTQQDIKLRGHAIECRITCEDPNTFLPKPGRITEYHPPGGFGVRVDSGIYGGYWIPPYYDSLLAKLIVYAPTRQEAISRMKSALSEYIIEGVTTNIKLHQKLLEHPEFKKANLSCQFLSLHLNELKL
jgi:acetyl-CoA carboxylase biotin carboxylase subunit